MRGRQCEHRAERKLKMLALKIRVMHPQAKEWMPTAIRSGKGQEMDSLLDPLEEAYPFCYLDFGPVILVFDFWTLEL